MKDKPTTNHQFQGLCACVNACDICGAERTDIWFAVRCYRRWPQGEDPRTSACFTHSWRTSAHRRSSVPVQRGILAPAQSLVGPKPPRRRRPWRRRLAVYTGLLKLEAQENRNRTLNTTFEEHKKSQWLSAPSWKPSCPGNRKIKACKMKIAVTPKDDDGKCGSTINK